MAVLAAFWLAGSNCYARQDLGEYDSVTAKTLLIEVKARVSQFNCEQLLHPGRELVKLETLINSVDGAGALDEILSVMPSRPFVQVQPREIFYRAGDLGEAIEQRLRERSRYGVFYLPGKGWFLAMIHSPYRRVDRYSLYRLNSRQMMSLLENLQAKLEE